MFSREYPNSGRIRVMLSEVERRILDRILTLYVGHLVVREGATSIDDLVIDENFVPYSEIATGMIYEDIKALIAVATEIALQNTQIAHYSLRLISILLRAMKESVSETINKRNIIKQLKKRLCSIPNSQYLHIWLQNITYPLDKEEARSAKGVDLGYQMPLCDLVMGQTNTHLWNNDWLREELAKDFPYESIVNRKLLSEHTPVIKFKEIDPYLNMGGYSDSYFDVEYSPEG